VFGHPHDRLLDMLTHSEEAEALVKKRDKHLGVRVKDDIVNELELNNSHRSGGS